MRLNIQYKITLVFVVLLAVVLAATYFYLDNTLRNNAYQEIEKNILKESDLVKTFLEEEGKKGLSKNQLDFFADKTSEALDLRVTIIGLDGKVLGDSDLTPDEIKTVENHFHRPEVQDALLTGLGESRRFSTTLQKHMLYVARSVTSGEMKGIVRLAIPLSGLEQTSENLKQVLSVAMFAAFILFSIAGALASKAISRRLQEMARVSKKIAAGDFSEKMVISSKDEAADLAEAFNFMIEQIKARIQDITTGSSRFEAVLLSMFDGVVVVDSKGMIILMNPSLASLLQIKDNPAGRKPVEVIRNIDVQEIMEEALSSPEGVRAKEVSVLMPEQKTLMVHATPVAKEGKSMGAVLVFHDITELRTLENLRRDFVANVSHELRTPISNIKGYAETLLDGAIDDEENAQEFVKIIHEETDRLAKLIADILSLSGIESGKLDMVFEACSIKDLTERVVDGLSRKAADKEISIKIDLGGKETKVSADEARITQVLLNLIENAIKYSLPGGRIRIWAEERDNFLQVNVEDTGIGIPEEDQPRIFERFYRVDKARSREQGGTGLGLSIVKHIVQEHGGEVSVKSAPGQGSTFSFSLPIA